MAALQVKYSFEIVFRDKTYSCDEITVDKTTLYRINFPKSPLHMTEAVGKSGEKYWACIPWDEKLKHILPELGALIKTHQRN